MSNNPENYGDKTRVTRQKRSKTGQLGVNVVERIVIDDLLWRWQSLDQQNDDGLDGLIMVENGKGELTGQIIFAQVKCWSKRRPKSGKLKLNVNPKKLEVRARRWRRVAGASIIVWVDPKNKEAFWADLQNPENILEKSVLISLKDRFSEKSANRLRQLAGTQGDDNLLPLIRATYSELQHIHPTRPLKVCSKEFFKNIGFVNSCDQRIGSVHFSRVGWKHITRPERPVSRVVQSLQLLRIAKRMVEEVPEAQLLRRIGSANNPAEIYSLTARVTFPHRDAAVIRVIVLRQLVSPTNLTPKSWFYSVYERRRRHGLRGEHKG